MKRRAGIPIVVSLLAAWLSLTAAGAAPIDLLEALDRGLVTAEFRGAGDTGVRGTIVRQTPQPLQVVVNPGTVFRAQFGFPGGGAYPGGGGYRGGGGVVQGISTFQSTPADLTTYRIAQVFVPGGCANYGLRAPTPHDVMVALPPPNRTMARLAQVIGAQELDQQKAQVALWAVANNVPQWAARRYVSRRMPPGTSKDAISARTEHVLAAAEGMVKKAGLDPKKYRTFR
ncbi:MAG: hypothetical protein PVH68_07485 [Armatimonadota bacterium]